MTLWYTCPDPPHMRTLLALFSALDEPTAPLGHRAFRTVDALDAAVQMGPRVALAPSALVVASEVSCETAGDAADGGAGARLGAFADRWRAALPGVRIVQVGPSVPGALLAALRAGADGYVALDQPLEAALRTLRAALGGTLWLSARDVDALRGHLRRRSPVSPRLSPREHEILRLLADGHTQPRIAARLGLAATTVSTHVQRLYDKLDVRGAPAAVLTAARCGLIPF